MPSAEMRIPCKGGELVVTAEDVAVASEQPYARWQTPRHAITGVDSAASHFPLLRGHDQDLILFTAQGQRLQAQWLTVAQIDECKALLGEQPLPAATAKPTIAPNGTVDASHAGGNGASFVNGTAPTADLIPRAAPIAGVDAEPPRRTGRSRWSRTRLALTAAALLLALAGAFVGAEALLQPRGQTTTAALRASPTGTLREAGGRTTPTLSDFAPVPLAVTCAAVVNRTRGELCVHTQPGAALTVSVRYCSGFGPSDTSAALRQPARADASGDHTWRWSTRVTCAGDATAYVTTSWNGHMGYYVYTFAFQ